MKIEENSIYCLKKQFPHVGRHLVENEVKIQNYENLKLILLLENNERDIFFSKAFQFTLA